MPVLSLKLPLLHLFQSLLGKGVPNFFKDKCSDEFLVQSSLNFCYICYSVTGVTKCVCWKICVLFVKYLMSLCPLQNFILMDKMSAKVTLLTHI